MARNIRFEGDPTEIGEARSLPFARVPDPAKLFERRAARLRVLAGDTGIGPYLGLLAELAAAQGRIAADAGDTPAADDAQVARALEFGMPPLDRAGFTVDADFRALADRLFEAAGAIDKPAAAVQALRAVREAEPPAFDAMVAQVLADSIPVEAMAAHVYVAAALQVRFVRAASTLPERKLKSVGDGACPACGGPPVASLVVGWPQAGGARYCACALCATLWHHVRVKCVSCSSTAGIGYLQIDGGPGTIKAETCTSCGTYVKILDQQKDVGLEPLADDVASLGIDLLMKDTEFRRAALNPFLLGY